MTDLAPVLGGRWLGGAVCDVCAHVDGFWDYERDLGGRGSHPVLGASVMSGRAPVLHCFSNTHTLSSVSPQDGSFE